MSPYQHMTPVDPHPDQEEHFDVLSSERRRLLLDVLDDHGALELSELTDRVSAREAGTTLNVLDPAVQKRVYISCYQTYIPRLASAGLIDYNTDSGMVEPTHTRESTFRVLNAG